MKALRLALVAVGILAVVLASVGCDEETTPQVPPVKSGNEAVMIEVGLEQFTLMSSSPAVIKQQVELTHPQSVIVTLGSNRSTGFGWTENAVISDKGVVTQFEHNYVAPGEGAVAGSPGKQVWAFKSAGKGASVVKMEYSRPWQGGEKGVFVYELTVTVK